MGNIFSKNLKLIKMSNIERNPEQPRKYFEPTSLEDLKLSIVAHGIINPISVIKRGNIYQIVAGERRFRAARLAGLKEIPCVILTADKEKSALISLVENIQRCDLDFVEEAIAYKKIIDDFGLKQDDFARSIGKTQSSVANKLRILKLSTEMLLKIRENSLTERHARALLKLEEDKRCEVLDYIIKNNLNVANTEAYIESLFICKKKKSLTYIKLAKDVRLFVNTINKSIKIMQDAGVEAKIDKKITDECTTFTIIIPTQN